MNHAVTQGTFDLDRHLIGQGDRGSARALSFGQGLRDAAALDRILGLRDVDDGESVHADYWEIHPDGDEVLCMLSGRIEVMLAAGREARAVIEIAAGQGFIVPRATWHRLRLVEPGRLLFSTPGNGTELRLDSAVADASGRSSGPCDRSQRDV